MSGISYVLIFFLTTMFKEKMTDDQNWIIMDKKGKLYQHTPTNTAKLLDTAHILGTAI